VTDYGNLLVTCLTMKTNPVHFEAPFAETTRFGQIIVNSTLTLALVTGLTVLPGADSRLVGVMGKRAPAAGTASSVIGNT